MPYAIRDVVAKIGRNFESLRDCFIKFHCLPLRANSAADARIVRARHGLARDIKSASARVRLMIEVEPELSANLGDAAQCSLFAVRDSIAPGLSGVRVYAHIRNVGSLVALNSP